MFNKCFVCISAVRHVCVCVCVSPRVEAVMGAPRWGATGVWWQDRRWRRATMITHSLRLNALSWLLLFNDIHVIKPHIVKPLKHKHTPSKEKHSFPLNWSLQSLCRRCLCVYWREENNIIRNRKVGFSEALLHNCILKRPPSKIQHSIHIVVVL